MIILDIEAVPQERFLTDPPEWFLECKWNPKPKFGNLKDPAKIEAKTKEWEESGGKIKDLSVNPMTAMPIIISMLVNDKTIEWFDKDKKLGDSVFEYTIDDIIENTPLITHNGKGYDLPLLALYCAQNRWWRQARDFTQLITGKYHNDRHIDLMLYFEDKFNLPYMSLENMGNFLDVEVNKHGDGSEIYGWYKQGKWGDIRKHCENDVKLTYAITQKLGIGV